MRHVFAVIRDRRCLLAALGVVLFIAWVWYFHSAVSPPPQFTFSTRAQEIVTDPELEKFRVLLDDDPQTWTTLQGIADDGGQATVGVHHGRKWNIKTRLERRDTRTGENATPRWWFDPERNGLQYSEAFRKTGLRELVSDSFEEDFSLDNKVWNTFRHRMVTKCLKAICNTEKTSWEDEVETLTEFLPQQWSFSPDGNLWSYVAQNGSPVYFNSGSHGDGTIIEDVKTGDRIAYLPTVTTQLFIAPGGHTAVSDKSRVHPKGEQPKLELWDLQTSALRAELLLPEVDFVIRVRFSDDGRFVFVHYYPDNIFKAELRWWDTASGMLVGHVVNVGEMAFLGGGERIVTHPSRVGRDWTSPRLVDTQLRV